MSQGIICHQTVCKDYATVRYTWPGKPEQAACDRHGALLVKMAGVCGFELHTYPLTPSEHLDAASHLHKKP